MIGTAEDGSSGRIDMHDSRRESESADNPVAAVANIPAAVGRGVRAVANTVGTGIV